MYILPVIFVAALIAIDQWTKYLALTLLKPIGSVAVIDGFMGLCYVENGGAAFGILQGARWLFVALTVLILIGIAYYYATMPRTKPYGWVRVALVIVTAGAIANCIDRVRNGYVVDFFQTLFMDFPVFNVADIYVVTGSILLTVLLIFFIKDEKSPDNTDSDGTEPEPPDAFAATQPPEV